MEEKKYLTASEIAADLEFSIQTVIRWIRTGVIPGAQFGSRWRVLRVDYETWKAARASSETLSSAPPGEGE